MVTIYFFAKKAAVADFVGAAEEAAAHFAVSSF